MIKFTKWVLTLISGFALLSQVAKADEGMWPLTMLSQLQDKMTARGLKLTAEDIYSINKSSLKDGVVRLVNKQNRMFCTGEIISAEGLFLTNHHCGYGAIQELSTPIDNILRNGFWAKNREMERPANFNIALLLKVEDVTDRISNGITVNQAEAERAAAVRNASTKVTQEIIKIEKEKGNEMIVEIIPFYSGNRFLAMYYEIYKDIRLVGTPPENMGKFGGDTDNWMWPRHTADFSMFRIYVNKQNKPAEYSKENQPYSPRHFFPVSTSGVSFGDYAMIMGYPGRTTRYAYSGIVKFQAETERPARVNLRRAVLDQFEKYMHKDPKVRLMYADKHAGISNYWKKFLGERDGLKALKVAERRKEVEEQLQAWIKKNGKESVYRDMIPNFEEVLNLQKKYALFGVYLQEALFSSQIFANGFGMETELDSLSSKNKAVVERAKDRLKKSIPGNMRAYKEFYTPIERDVLEVAFKMTYEGLDKSLQPLELEALVKKHKGDFKVLADQILATSLFADSNRLKAFLQNPEAKTLSKDPLIPLFKGISKKGEEINSSLMPMQAKSSRANRLLQAGLMEMNPNSGMGPDANGTMRLTYGRVLDYEPKDAVLMNYMCTHKGILEKYIKDDYEFDAPDKLIDLLQRKDFGRWADKEGNLPVCFLTDNDITGGNSGSPVLNAKGELIGTAFDGNWEAISSDFAFEPKLQRTINLDVRYTLFIIEKIGGAGHLLNEMKLVQTMPETVPAPAPEPVIEPIKSQIQPVMKPAIVPAKKMMPKKGAPVKN